MVGANSTEGFFHQHQPSINVTANSTTIPFQKDDAYFLAGLISGQIPIGRGAVWLVQRTWMAVTGQKQESHGRDEEGEHPDYQEIETRPRRDKGKTRD